VETGEAGLPFHLGIDPVPGAPVFRLGLIESGAMRILGPGAPILVTAGCLFLVPPGCPCRFLRQPGARVRGVSFGRSLVDPLILGSTLDSVVETLAARDLMLCRLNGAQLAEAGALLASLEREAREHRPGSEPMVRLKLLQGILTVSRAGTGGAHETVRFHAEEARQYIREHCADELTLDGIASRYGHNPSYFSRLFHREAGLPLVEFINRCRVEKSCQLLKRTDAAIVEIAIAVGYNNLSHFNRSFRRFIGMSPREYRAGRFAPGGK
jgi:AraC-like DNA-binding protein